ncbi:pyruvoyl-dependent arginine decarboxylase [Patescibacteria group bacterium]|nr:pyruvoyl-dependent arginine decarboxylase [Patescibacteria group bacterium]
MWMPEKVFFTRGVGAHKEELTSFEVALRHAGIAPFNLLSSLSSILPVGCKRISREEGLGNLKGKEGSILFSVHARISSNEPGRLLAASIGAAVPKDTKQYGYLSEFHGFGKVKQNAGDYAEDLAAQMLAATLGLHFDPNISWDEREKVFKMSGKIVKTFNITQTARVNKNGWWTTVFAAAVFLFSFPQP